MDLIPDIRTSEINIKDIRIPSIPDYLTTTPPITNYVIPPVVQGVGVPIVDIPGCVEAHPSNKGKGNNLNEDDPKGTLTFCDAGVPSFNPLDYNKDELEFTREAPVPPVKTPEAPETPEVKTPETPAPPVNSAVVKCPTREQELKNPIGKILEGDLKITGYELVGKECLMVTEALTIPDQIIGNIPNAGKVTTTAGIAVIATTSALLAKPFADLLLKVVKPTVKKVMKKIATLRGKTVPHLSVKERQDLQRERTEAIRQLRSVLKPKG